jgi:hypothetical protein
VPADEFGDLPGIIFVHGQEFRVPAFGNGLAEFKQQGIDPVGVRTAAMRVAPQVRARRRASLAVVLSHVALRWHMACLGKMVL